MKFAIRPILLGAFLATGLTLNTAFAPDAYAKQTRTEAYSKAYFCKDRLKGEVFARTELFFGLSKPDSSVITEEEFKSFIDSEVTPRFPEGLTLLAGNGQFKDAGGTIINEGSKLLILLYPFSAKSNRAIEEIRQVYINTFQQQSVLRVDEPSCVSF